MEKCIGIAVKALRGKRDRDGNTVVLHSLIVGSMGKTNEEKCVGFLHDVLEDTDLTGNDLRDEGVIVRGKVYNYPDLVAKHEAALEMIRQKFLLLKSTFSAKTPVLMTLPN